MLLVRETRVMTLSAAALERYDPKQLIRQALEFEDANGTTARECVFLWLMSLADDVDPAEAATALLPMVVDACGGPDHPLRQGLATELREVSRHPRATLRAMKHRRGRPSGRRSSP